MLISRRTVFLTTFAAITTLLLLYYIQPNALHNIKVTMSSLENKTNTKFILYYTTMFDNDNFYMGKGSKIFEHCPVSDCYATPDRTLMPLDKFHALMFHANGFDPFGAAAPKVRHPDQYYIWVNMESPPNSHLFPSTNYFNWTMTYRLDSDIHWNYGSVAKQKTNYSLPTVEDIKKIPKKIAWAVSNCQPKNRRDKLAEAINKLMTVDIFGKCGHLSCPQDRGGDCFKDYKFYLSFENSNCYEYVTEKLFKTLNLNIIPIVYGGANYTNYVPPHSVIDVSDFESVDHLIRYLKELDDDPKKFLEYFHWKKDYIVNVYEIKMLCTLCEKLHKPLNRQVYEDVTIWYKQLKNGGKACKPDDELPNIVKNIK